MLKVSMPIAFTPEEIWVFAEIGDHCVGARVAITDTNAVVLALPCDQFDINGLFPTYPETGDLIPGVRWANADDMNSHPGSFTNQ